MQVKYMIGVLISIMSFFLLSSSVVHAANTSRTSSAHVNVQLNQADVVIAKKFMRTLRQRKFNSALEISNRSSNEIFKRLAVWLVLTKANNSVEFDVYDRFLRSHTDWPKQKLLREKAEKAIHRKAVSDHEIISFFSRDKPLTGWGELQFGQALYQQGKKESGIKMLRQGFITATLSSDQMRRLVKAYKNILTQQDFLQRASYLAWNNRYWDLRRMLKYLSYKQRALYYARFVLQACSAGADYSISQVDSTLQDDEGLLFDRFQWRIAKGKIVTAIQLKKDISTKNIALRYGNHWLKEQLKIARKKVYAKEYREAYDILQNHAANSPAVVADAEWLSGWLVLRYIDKPNAALKHFKKMNAVVTYPISKARAAYWMGKTYEVLNQSTKSKRWYTQASQYATTFYGQLAADKINRKVVLKDHSVKGKRYAQFRQSELAQAVLMLKQIKYSSYARDLVLHLGGTSQTIENRTYAGHLAHEIGRYEYAVRFSKHSSYEHVNLLAYNYPEINLPNQRGNIKLLPKEYIFSLIRQESEFATRVNSAAGAKGLMQIMPATARIISRQLNLPYSKNKLMNDPEYNLRLGSHLISSLTHQYDGSLMLALSAYNAGPGRVKTWLRTIGDPRTSVIDSIDFIEHIPFTETRNYVQRVFENITVYHHLNKSAAHEGLTSGLVYNQKGI
jgi:soluble lytic murein transglycosylase